MKIPTHCRCGCGAELPKRSGWQCGQWKYSLPGHVTLRIRYLKSGDAVPAWEPKRYSSQRGYVRLRWKMPDFSYVEVYEHRVVNGFVVDAEHVHHKNHDRADNRPENLEHLPKSAHMQMHAKHVQKFSFEEAAALYAAGLGVVPIARRFGVNPVTVLRRLKRYGVVMRARGRRWDIMGLEAR